MASFDGPPHLHLVGDAHGLDSEGIGELHEVGVRGIGRGNVALVVEELLPLVDHSEHVVVDDGELNRQTILDDGGELAHGHLEAAVASNRPDGLIGRADLHSHSARHLVAHCAGASRRDEGAGVLVGEVLGGPHLVLADAGHDDGVSAGNLRQLPDDELRQELVRVADVVRRVLRLELLDALEPFGVGIFLDLRVELRQHTFEVSHDWYVDLDVLADFGGVDVDVDLLGSFGRTR